MKDRKLLLVLSQSLIGTGFFFLYIQHVRSIFETKVAHLTQLEREALFRREDALYYSFYKTLTEAPDFWSGYDKLKNVTNIEYPRSVNVLQRFDLLPEITIGYLYHLLRYYGGNGVFQIFSCWRANDIRLPIEHRRCDMHAQPMQFYLEFVWLLGGMTILVVYMYGTLLSENIFGGIYAVVSYIMFHSYASKIYERPCARENFAFPVIFLQIFYLSMCFDRIAERKEHSSRFFITLKLTLLTTVALLCWQFSSIIFALQLIITALTYGLNPTTAFNNFSIDYAFSQVLGNILAFYLSLGNRKYFYSWQMAPAVGMFFVYLVRSIKSNTRKLPWHTISMGTLMAFSVQNAVVDVMKKTGQVHPVENSFALYRDLSVHWSLNAKVNFVTSLAACNPAYNSMEWTELWELIKTLIVKPYCMYGVVTLAKFFRKWRKSSEKKTPNLEYIERAKKYVLEDFLEENHVSMREMSNKETENELNNCLKLLEQCNFDYDLYKQEKSKLKEHKPNEHEEFMNRIKKLKEQINELNETKRQREWEDNNCKQNAMHTTTEKVNCENVRNEQGVNDREGESDAKAEGELDCATTTPPISINSTPKEAKTKPSKSEASTQSEFNSNSNNTNSGNNRRSRTAPKSTNSKRNAADGNNKSDATANTATSTTTSSTTAGGGANSSGNKRKSPLDIHRFISIHYLYSIVQMIIFLIIGLSVKKLFFLCFTQGCVIAPTLCTKFWYRKQRNIFWTISLAVFLTSMFDPGLVNIREEYFPTKYAYGGNDDLDSMLEWIKMNTEKDAVFAGPIDIIGTVHLTTNRPIVNHAHLEMQQISERTEHVYSVFSRQQSSDIYNQYSQLKIQYLIISVSDCSNEVENDCDLLSIWDDMQPAYRKYPQFCAELTSKNIPSFLKVFINDNYGIIKMFSQSVQINLRYSKMPEKAM